MNKDTRQRQREYLCLFGDLTIACEYVWVNDIFAAAVVEFQETMSKYSMRAFNDICNDIQQLKA